MDFGALVSSISSWIAGPPLLFFVIGVSIVCTISLRFIQFRLFYRAWQVTLTPDRHATGEMTPFQAFINTLSASIGNGSIAGVATAVYAGGPGSAFWLVIFGLILMAVRFVEVYASAWYGMQKNNTQSHGMGGPMLYLKKVVPGGELLATSYAAACLLFGLVVGNAVQTNSIALSMQTAWNINSSVIAVLMSFFVAYILFGGAKRIVIASEAIVPIKVGVFFLSALAILGYHYAAIPGALSLIMQSAFSTSALSGSILGFSVVSAMRYGMQSSVMATESGLGTIAILFGFTGDTNPMRSALMGMIGTFISTLVCFLVGLCIVVSGVWSNGLTSTQLTIAAYNTVFGWYGGWIVTFLSVTFGIGVLVAYAYIARAAFLYLTKDRWEPLFVIMYCVAAFFGAITTATTIFEAANIPQAMLLGINLFGLMCLLPRLRKTIFNHVASTV